MRSWTERNKVRDKEELDRRKLNGKGVGQRRVTKKSWVKSKVRYKEESDTKE